MIGQLSNVQVIGWRSITKLIIPICQLTNFNGVNITSMPAPSETERVNNYCAILTHLYKKENREIFVAKDPIGFLQ